MLGFFVSYNSLRVAKVQPKIINQEMNMLKKKIFTTAPLPFQGQKRKFLKQFKPGLLSHTVKSIYPNAWVIYNDFDNYRERLQNIDKTNQLIADIRIIIKDVPDNKRITGTEKNAVLERVSQECKNGYVDFITLSSSILFSMKYVLSFEALEKETFYNTVRQSAYDADGYLDGIEVVTIDYKQLFAKYKDLPNVVFLVDPPYLSTDSGTYKNVWKLKDYLDVLQVLDGTNYFYFTSNKSSIIELCEWIETKTPMSNPFTDASTETMNASVTYSSSYTDIMLFKNINSNNTANESKD